MIYLSHVLYIMSFFDKKGPQRDFDRVEGILDTVVGYSGSRDGSIDPTYKNIKDCKYT